MHHKSQTQTILQSFVVLIQTQFNHKIKQIQSDNGAEFLMSEFYNSHDIIHQQSCVAIPQQNGVVARKHKHILEVARALCFQSNLPLKCWGDCILTVV